MNATRLKALAKLGLLLGIPVSVVLGLFSAGIYVGVEHQVGILTFERDWLGRDVDVPGAPASETPAETPAPERISPEPSKAPDATPSTPPTKKAPAPPPVTTPDGHTPPAPTTPTPAIKPSPYLIASLPAPANPRQLQTKRRIKIKVLVDRAIILRNSDWISAVQNTVRWSSAVLDAQVGVRLELVGVSTWSPNTLDTSQSALREDLATHAHDGADLVLGLTDHALASALPAPRPDSGAFLPASALVLSELDAEGPRVHGLLLAIGEILGAQTIRDTNAREWQTGSWMSSSPLSVTRKLHLDPANRQRILDNKMHEFAAPPPRPAAIVPTTIIPSTPPATGSPSGEADTSEHKGGADHDWI